MGTIVLILALVSVCLIAGTFYCCFKGRNRSTLAGLLLSMKPARRKLSTEERRAIEYYLNQYNTLENILLSGAAPQPANKLTLSTQSNTVYAITHAITRYGLASNEPNHWRYYLDAEEIHLPAFLEPHISTDNRVELIKTETLLLVISLNGHSLLNDIYHTSVSPVAMAAASTKNAHIHQHENKNEYIELVNIRQETSEEQAVNHPNGIKEAVIISTALLLLFFSLISPIAVTPWMVFLAILMLTWGGWNLLRRPAASKPQEIHCLRGTPKCWGLFGESNQGKVNNISLGMIDLVYPAHWQPYLMADLDKLTHVDIDLNRQVVRQGRYLSLHDEVKNFPLQQWGKNAVLATSSLVILLLLLTYIPLSLPAKLSRAWLQGSQNIEVTNVQKLQTTPLIIGNVLKVKGNGMCYAPIAPHSTKTPDFAPFDCSEIYWNNSATLAPPESAVANKAIALLDTMDKQLHSSSVKPKIGPRLISAIDKSGMILLPDFPDIILKTQDLCGTDTVCTRLEKALVNLSNAKNWGSLVKKAKSGNLQGVNVLLRPINADALENLTKAVALAFITRETHQASQLLNKIPTGGFLIASDEGKSLVDHPQPAPTRNEHPVLGQWYELQRLSNMLLHTQFEVQGVITNIFIDANGTRHIELHSEPDKVTQWRYLGTSLLLLALVIIFGYNSWRWLQRWCKNRHRLTDIQRYYENCFNPKFSANSIDPNK
ncbi:Intracellular growth attenuator protein igaA [Serratia sp. S1B]|nr:Intracellular growth attenuator protein igaA [Serratia sp. S1B]